MIDREQLLAWPFEEVVQQYTARDAMLYALSLGFGDEPLDAVHLRHVLEDRLRVFPTMALVLAHPGPWTANPATGIDRKRVVHGEQSLVIHKPLPLSGTVRSRNRVVAVLDKGVDKGAAIRTERQLHDAVTGELLASIAGTTFCRGDGGFEARGGQSAAPAPAATPPRPERAPDAVASLPTRTQAALLYRLNGDYNPLHADPAAARAAGFERPISHGLLSFGLCARMIEESFPGWHLTAIDARFAKPMFPGETLVTELWRDGEDTLWFRALCKERNVEVLSNGRARLVRERE
ncbi:MAG TPA: MaoC/PaaZ C-terminal domain-containing protein [Ramlibacter sp.]|uniref:MaoC/PaaZ C-terminal domain-containing protein n=1 Tax=Ramlibacter sp. TaxID=1917967 RepID=UPI002ECFE9C0